MFVAVSRWEYRDYQKWCARLFDQQRFAEMAFDKNNSVVLVWNC